MPALHRYFGTPLTTFILNVMFGSRFSDIHCGMRGLTRDALVRMDLRSQGWEYASEMVLKSVHMRLVTTEVPINFLKDPEGRLSHMKRRGWLEPWRAGWMNLRAMLTYGVNFFLLKPGAVLLVLGLPFLIVLTLRPGHARSDRLLVEHHAAGDGSDDARLVDDILGRHRQRPVRLFRYGADPHREHRSLQSDRCRCLLVSVAECF